MSVVLRHRAAVQRRSEANMSLTQKPHGGVLHPDVDRHAMTRL